MLMMKNTKATGSAISSSPHLGRKHQGQDGDPAHGISSGRIPGTCSEASWLTGRSLLLCVGD